MKITRYDLCYGDFVYFKGISTKVIGVMMDGYEYVVVNEEGEPYNVSHIDDIEPIPITEDLLVKNGFAYNSQNDLLMWYDGCGHIHITIRERYCYVGYNGKRLYTSIQYVHELQHIMRFCKIEKKIEL